MLIATIVDKSKELTYVTNELNIKKYKKKDNP
jgi:hypothetical protein